MKCRRLRGQSGVTLMEVTLAIAIFAVVISVSAQSLMGFYAAIDLQKQRVEALQSARAVLSDIRLKRQEFELPDDVFDWDGLMGWIDDGNDDGWQNYLRINGANALREHTLDVVALDMDGNPAEAGDDPVELQVVTTWQDLRGRTISAVVATIISEK